MKYILSYRQKNCKDRNSVVIWWDRCVKINTKKIKCVEFIQDNEDIYV